VSPVFMWWYEIGGDVMTNEELALKIQNGERNLIPTLWEQVERFIYLKSENWYWQHEETCIRCGVALDDLKQVSYFAFLDAIRYYTSADGYKFLTYLVFPLRNRFNEACGIRTKAQAQRPLNRCKSLNAAVPGSEEGITYEDTIIDELAAEDFQRAEDDIYNEQLRSVLDECLATLPEVQSTVIQYRYFEGLTAEKAGQKVGLTYVQCRNRETEGLRKLRRGKNRKRLEAFAEDIISRYAYCGSYSLWKATGTSSTEYTALKLIEET
jgi:RNA polymerase sigma factor (sigma-70 family)